MCSLVKGIQRFTKEVQLKEEWKYVTMDGIELGRYLVSNKGRVFDTKNKVMKNILDNGFGYKLISLYIPSKGKSMNRYVHRLVAHEFCEGYSPSKEVNHIDEDKSNNCSENLQWVTSKQNTRHSIKTGRVNGVKRGSCIQTDESHREEVAKGLCGELSLGRLSSDLGLPRTTVSSMLNGRSHVRDMLDTINKLCCLDSDCRCSFYKEVLSNKV